MKLRFIKISDLDRNLKSTVHRSGKTGFTVEAAKKMQLETDKSLSIATNEDDSTDLNLYVVVENEKAKDAFSILKAGDYYYVNTKELYKTLGWDYVSNSISYDISETTIEGMKLFVFKTSIKKRKEMNKKSDQHS